MLRAGWGNWGGKCSDATISADIMVNDEWGQRSGQGLPTGWDFVDNETARLNLWKECVSLTGAKWPASPFVLSEAVES